MGLKTIISEFATQCFSRNKVLRGPFAGLAYPAKSVGSAYCPKLVGTYELELHAIINSWKSHPPRTVLNIGGAEGYYAVGLAKMFPDCRVVTYEADSYGRTLIQAMAELNAVSGNIKIKGLCQLKNLEHELEKHPKSLIIMDVEGAEDELLPANSNIFSETELLVEIHDELCPGVGGRLIERFNSSHIITQYDPAPRKTDVFEAAELKPFSWLPSFIQLKILDEKRGYNYWLHMAPQINESKN